jgi:hypothetical protein
LHGLIQFFALPAYVFLLVILFHFEFLNLSFWLCLKKFFGTDGDQIQLYFSKVELGNYITEQMSSVEDDDDVDSEIQMFQNALEFSGWRREILWAQEPRARIELFDSIAELKELFIETVILRLWYIKTHWMILWVTCIRLICLRS